MSILHQARFFTTADELHQLPDLGLPEIAFAGRSNAGKSTALNTLCNQKRLAFASKTPGRTQHINYFAVGRHPDDPEQPTAFLVDLPGYGYAAVSRTAQAHWGRLLSAYIQQRAALVGLVLIMDARHPMTELDRRMIDWFRPTGRPIHVLLTKADKLTRNESAQTLRTVRKDLAEYGVLHTVQLFSSLKRTGVEEAQQRIAELLGLIDPPADVLPAGAALS